MLVKSCIVKPIYQDRIPWGHLYTDILNTLVLSYNSISTVYDIPSFHRRHDRPNTSVYSCYYLQMPSTRFNWQAEMESPSPHLDSSARCNKEADKQKTQSDGRITQLTAWKLIGLVGDLWLVWWSCQFLSLWERETTSSRARISGTRWTSHQIVAVSVWTVLGWSGAEWTESPMQDRTAEEPGQVEVEREKVFL